MRMKEFVAEVKRVNGVTNYGLARDLRRRGVEVTTGAIDGYMKGVTKVRLDVLCALVEMLGRGWDYAGKLIEKGVKMKKLSLILLASLSFLIQNASAVDLECVGLTDSQCEAMRDCIATLGDLDPVCFALGTNAYTGNVCAEELSNQTDRVLNLNDEARKLKKRIKRLRRKVAELQE